MYNKLTEERVKEICKLGQAGQCCRYLVMGPDGFDCAKSDSKLKASIDERAEGMNAKGDNCDGVELMN